MGEKLNNSKKICAAAAALFLCLTQVYAQKAGTVTENTQVQQQETQPVDENTITIQTPDAPRGGTSKAATVWLFIRMILVLAVVIACIYAVVYFMKRSMKNGNNSDQFLRDVSSITLAQGKSVHIVSLLDNKAYIIGVSDNSVNLIGEVTDKELIDAMNLNADKKENVKKPRNFSDVLSIFMPGGPKEKNGSVFSGEGDKAADLLKQQRDRINPEK